jgi:hypothetical protein
MSGYSFAENQEFWGFNDGHLVHFYPDGTGDVYLPELVIRDDGISTSNYNQTGVDWNNLDVDLYESFRDDGSEAQNGGGIDPSFTGGVAVVGGMISGVGQSYKYGEHTVNYAQKVGGKVRGASVLTRASQMHAAKMVSGLKVIGRGVTGLGIATAGYQFLNSDQSGGDYARFTGAIFITTTAAIPFVGPIISIGLGAADAYGAFDDYYNYFDQ